MTAAITGVSDLGRTLYELAAEIQRSHRSNLRELSIEVVQAGVILRGRATSFYGKQLAFHEVRLRCRLMILANEIEVQEESATSSSE